MQLIHNHKPYQAFHIENISASDNVTATIRYNVEHCNKQDEVIIFESFEKLKAFRDKWLKHCGLEVAIEYYLNTAGIKALNMQRDYGDNKYERNVLWITIAVEDRRLPKASDVISNINSSINTNYNIKFIYLK